MDLSQILVEDGTEMLLGLDTEDAERIDLTVHGQKALGIIKGLDCTIHWTEGQLVYILSGTVPMEELEKMCIRDRVTGIDLPGEEKGQDWGREYILSLIHIFVLQNLWTSGKIIN